MPKPLFAHIYRASFETGRGHYNSFEAYGRDAAEAVHALALALDSKLDFAAVSDVATVFNSIDCYRFEIGKGLTEYDHESEDISAIVAPLIDGRLGDMTCTAIAAALDGRKGATEPELAARFGRSGDDIRAKLARMAEAKVIFHAYEARGLVWRRVAEPKRKAK